MPFETGKISVANQEVENVTFKSIKMTTHDAFLKSSFQEWMRLSSIVTEIVGELEGEIARMRDRKVSESLIEQKDTMIEKLITFYNATDQLITAQRIAIANKDAEIMIMNDSLTHALRSDWRERILARLTQDVKELKERKELKQELIDKING